MIRYPWLRGERPPPKRSRFRAFMLRHLQGLSVTGMVLLLAGFVLYPYMLITVPSGEVGVLWKRFTGPGVYCFCILPSGTVLKPEEIRNEGLHVIWPWDSLFIYDLRLQTTTKKYNAISSDGVSVTAEITLRYQLVHPAVAVLHQFIGPSYMDKVLTPEIASQTRSVISKYMASEIYSTRRQQIEDEIATGTRAALDAHLHTLFQAAASEQPDAKLDPMKYENLLEKSINILDTLVLSIELPTEIVAAINSKTQQFYMIAEYEYRVAREEQESKRKQIEANGIAAFQQTVSQGISDSYLRWRGIEATLALAQSQNAKIVIIGGGKEGLPIILGNVDAPTVRNPDQKPSDGGTSPSGKTPTGSTAPTTEGTSPGTSSSNSDKRPGGWLDQIDIEALIASITNALRGTESGDHSGTGTNSK